MEKADLIERKELIQNNSKKNIPQIDKQTGRWISDITEASDVFNIDGLLVTMDIEKAFDSLNHSFQ